LCRWVELRWLKEQARWCAAVLVEVLLDRAAPLAQLLQTRDWHR
jgi:hypothetical protein